MANHDLFPAADGPSLRTLPKLTASDRAVLEEMLHLAPDVAVSTAAAVVRQHQPDLHELIFLKGPERGAAEIAPLARALVYLGLAVAAPGQGKILPTLSRDHLQRAFGQVRVRLALWGQASVTDGLVTVEADAVPDPELRRVIEALVARMSQPSGRDPRWLRAVAFSEAGAFYHALAEACDEQFGQAVDLSVVADHLQRLVRTRDLIADALAPEAEAKAFNPSRQANYVERLHRFGWREFRSSDGRTLPEIAAEAAEHGFLSTTSFALSDEWEAHGASLPTVGRRFFIRPSLLPDSGGLALWAQEERLKPLQKMLAGDPNETGLRLTLGTAEVLLEYATRTSQGDFLAGQWTRVRNRYDGLQTRLGFLTPYRFAITLFPASRLDSQVGVCPVIEVEHS